MPGPDDIEIGDDAVIEWISLDGRYQTAVRIDDLIPDADWFWRALRGHCVPECCGIDAFDLTPVGIQWAIGADVPPPGIISWRPEKQGDPFVLAQQLDETIAAVHHRGADVVSSTLFNQLFDTAVFVELVEHIANVLRQAGADMVVTTDP